MSPPSVGQQLARSSTRVSVSRRGFLAGTTVAAVAAAVGVELLSPAGAYAAVAWGYPFTFRSGRSRGFTGAYSQGLHAGIDYTPGIRTPIHAVADGDIIISGITGSGGAYGESVWIQHADGYRSIYAHMFPGTRAPVGPVRRGEKIGEVGNTGQSYGAHLHIEIHRNNVALDPDLFINDAPLAGTSTPPIAPSPKDIEMRTIYNIDGVNSDEPDLRRRAIVGEFTFQPLSLGAAQREFKLWGAPENVTQAEWDGYRTLVNTRRIGAGMPPL